MNEINYSQGWNWGEDIYASRSRFKPYWHAFRNPVPSVLKYCRRRNIKLNRILEVGCGGGNFGILFIIRNLNVYFIDAAMDMLNTCRLNFKKVLFLRETKDVENKLSCQDMFNLGIKDEQFDLVISDGVYEHLHEKEVRLKFLIESKRVIKKGGCLFVAIPNDKHPLVPYWKKKGYCWLDRVNNPLYYEIELSVDEFQNELKEAGFYDIYCDGFRFWGFITRHPNTKLRWLITLFLKAFVPEMTRNIRLKYADWLWVIGRKG